MNDMKVVESLMAVERIPRRPFPGKPGMRPQYVKRIAKKWLKRFGTIDRPCFYLVDPAATLSLYAGGGSRLNPANSQKIIVAHPALVPKLRETLARMV